MWGHPQLSPPRRQGRGTRSLCNDSKHTSERGMTPTELVFPLKPIPAKPTCPEDGLCSQLMRKIRVFWETSTSMQSSTHIQEESVPSNHPAWGTSFWGDDSPSLRCFLPLLKDEVPCSSSPSLERRRNVLYFSHETLAFWKQWQFLSDCPDLQLYYMQGDWFKPILFTTSINYVLNL